MEIAFVGATQSGKSVLCGHILHQYGRIKKSEVHHCREVAKAHGGDDWHRYLMDINYEELKSGSSM